MELTPFGEVDRDARNAYSNGLYLLGTQLPEVVANHDALEAIGSEFITRHGLQPSFFMDPARRLLFTGIMRDVIHCRATEDNNLDSPFVQLHQRFADIYVRAIGYKYCRNSVELRAQLEAAKTQARQELGIVILDEEIADVLYDRHTDRAATEMITELITTRDLFQPVRQERFDLTPANERPFRVRAMQLDPDNPDDDEMIRLFTHRGGQSPMRVMAWARHTTDGATELCLTTPIANRLLALEPDDLPALNVGVETLLHEFIHANFNWLLMEDELFGSLFNELGAELGSSSCDWAYAGIERIKDAYNRAIQKYSPIPLIDQRPARAESPAAEAPNISFTAEELSGLNGWPTGIEDNTSSFPAAHHYLEEIFFSTPVADNNFTHIAYLLAQNIGLRQLIYLTALVPGSYRPKITNPLHKSLLEYIDWLDERVPVIQPIERSRLTVHHDNVQLLALATHREELVEARLDARERLGYVAKHLTALRRIARKRPKDGLRDPELVRTAQTYQRLHHAAATAGKAILNVEAEIAFRTRRFGT